jgi:hypothetical protein
VTLIEIYAWDIEVQLNDDELKVLDNQSMMFDQQSKEKYIADLVFINYDDVLYDVVRIEV